MTSSEVRRTPAFVDEVGDTTLRIVLDEEAYSLPRALAPAGVKEGTWIEIEIKAIPTPQDAARTPALRRSLGKKDDGGDFGL